MCQLAHGNQVRHDIPAHRAILAFKIVRVHKLEQTAAGLAVVRFRPKVSPNYPEDGWRRDAVYEAHQKPRVKGPHRVGFFAYKRAKDALMYAGTREAIVVVPVYLWGRVIEHCGNPRVYRGRLKEGYRAQFMRLP